MARLVLTLALALSLPAAAVFPSGNPGQDPPQDRVHRLKSLLEQPQPSVPSWRVQVWQQLKRLEHGPSSVVLRGWQALAESGNDADLANLLIYQRRHLLPLEPVRPGEGAESTLERCLHLWGSGQIPATRKALLLGMQKFPQDRRFTRNLHWLDLTHPPTISWDETPREFALAVLAARQPHD